jgi:murein L,D-transpeptidase YafK
MKQLVFLLSVFFGSSLTATDYHSARPFTTNKRISSAAGPVGRVSIIIDKSDYELTVYDEEGWYATYPVVFGNNSLEDKKMEGDKNTPEGTFKITTKRVHDKWCRFLAIDYPTKESVEKFNRRKQKGEIPANAKIGGGIGIHGTWPHEDFVIDRYKNWTLGCISMKNDDVKDLYQYIGSGTQVSIRK